MQRKESIFDFKRAKKIQNNMTLLDFLVDFRCFFIFSN